ncbi:thrombospondin [Micromonospora sp. PSH03]|uniref:sulfite exporter TauE/SafE family protein n=1 Tax=Micromonospora salmantinae TaxID=2911211 RepID=UPI001EE817A7|nr:sulfite exporter TauE/SafE family protein [Micromonospora salmantinae]MCG5455008.1 thrombospondin [Micromonospora salmantinae]
MVRIPSLSRRSEPAPTRDENLDGRVDGRDAPVTETGQSDDGVGRPVVTDRDADQTTYRSAGATDSQTSEAERRANERAAVARAATARPAETEPRGTARPVAPEPVNGTTRPVAPEPVTDTTSPVTPEPRTARTVETDSRPTVAPATARTAERGADPDSTTRRPDSTDRVTTDRPVDPTPGVSTPEPPVTRGPKPRASLLATLGLIVSVAGAMFVLTGTLAGYGIGLGAFGAVLAVLGLMATRRRHVAGKTDALFGVLIGLAAVVIGVLAMTGQFDWPTTDGDWVPRFREWLDSQFVDRF